MSGQPARIVIIGGGFAGVECARTLAKRLPPERAELVLFNAESHMVFHPLLAEVAGASVSPDAVAASLRQMLGRVRVRTEQVAAIELAQRTLVYQGYDERLHRFPYDHVVVACGEAINHSTIPGMGDHSLPLKTIGDALAIRAHVMEQLERADVCDDPDRKRWYLTFVVVGGGYSGVETAGEINDLARGSCRYFRTLDPEEIRVQLVHSREQILPEISSGLRDVARVRMERAGIEFVLSARAEFVTAFGVHLSDGRELPAATVVCSIGTTATSLVERLDAPKQRGRLLTEPDLRLVGRDDAWAVGDCASTINAYDGEPAPPTGQFAEREGRQAAENIVRVLRGEPTRPFHHKPLGELCAIGGRAAVGELFGRRVSGFPAWFLWRAVYLFKLPTRRLRVKVGFDWAWELFFARDLAHLKVEPSPRVSTAHYDAGDFVFRGGDPATDFFVITRGQVEVLTADEREVLAVLRAGDFFGEMALLDQRAHAHAVRARTRVELLVTAQQVFDRLTAAFTPLRDALKATVRRRAGALWPRMPLAVDVLRGESLSRFVEALPTAPLRPDDTFETVVARMDAAGPDVCCVTDGSERLLGVVTRTDLLKAIEVGVRRTARVGDLMTCDPVAVCEHESPLDAATRLREHQLKWLPVVADAESRQLRGCVRAQTLLREVLQHAGNGSGPRAAADDVEAHGGI